MRIPAVPVNTIDNKLAGEPESAREALRLEPGQSHPVWSPHDAYQAADVLLKMLDQIEARP